MRVRACTCVNARVRSHGACARRMCFLTRQWASGPARPGRAGRAVHGRGPPGLPTDRLLGAGLPGNAGCLMPISRVATLKCGSLGIRTASWTSSRGVAARANRGALRSQQALGPCLRGAAQSGQGRWLQPGAGPPSPCCGSWPLWLSPGQRRGCWCWLSLPRSGGLLGRPTSRAQPRSLPAWGWRAPRGEAALTEEESTLRSALKELEGARV